MATSPEKLLRLIKRKKISNYDLWFELIASELFYHCDLKIKDQIFEITEIEFYINEPEHPDIFSHSTDEQKKNGQFYFHQTGNSFKEGNYKGMDIAIGNEQRFGGILIRSIKNIKTQQMIEGPSNVVSEILKIFELKKVKHLEDRIDLSINGSDMQIIKCTKASNKSSSYLKTPRVGLTLKRPAPKKTHFLIKDYRFLKYPELATKGRHWVIASALLKAHALKLPKKVIIKYETLLTLGRRKKIAYETTLDSQSSINDFIEFYGRFNLIES